MKKCRDRNLALTQGVATHADIPNCRQTACTNFGNDCAGTRKSHLSAFTLAEVLVTIGIIGIVAAMTIPSLINRYRTFVLMQQFKKAYAAVSVAAEKVQFDMGENVKCFYGTGGTGGTADSWDDCRLFFQELFKEMNTIKSCKRFAFKKGCLPPEFYKAPEDVFAEAYPNRDPDTSKEYFMRDCTHFSSENIKNDDHVYVLQGGFHVILYAQGNAPVFWVDVNGKKRPNKWGHDLFAFQFERGKISDSYNMLKPSTGCQLKEKDGYTSKEFFDLINRGTANF